MKRRQKIEKEREMNVEERNIVLLINNDTNLYIVH